jgi:hypothetical protein
MAISLGLPGYLYLHLVLHNSLVTRVTKVDVLPRLLKIFRSLIPFKVAYGP